MQNDIDVIKLASANTLLPNMTINVDDIDEDGEDQVTVEYGEQDDDDAATAAATNDGVKVEMKTLSPVKRVYENERYKELKELANMTEEERRKKNERLIRFDLSDDEYKEVIAPLQVEKSVDGEAAAKLAGEVAQYNATRGDDDEPIRPNALHMQGVDSLSTSEVLALFNALTTPPKHLEWLDDSSCNLVWGETDAAEVTAAVLLMITSEPAVDDAAAAAAAEDDVALVDEEKAKEDLDQLDLMETNEDDAVIEVHAPAAAAVVAAPAEPVEFRNSMRPATAIFSSQQSNNAFQLRFAFKGDQKRSGAAQKSRYYKKNGNPHFGGLRGVISKSYRRRHGRKRLRQDLADAGFGTQDYRPREKQTRYEREKTEQELDDEELLNTDVRRLDGCVYMGSSASENGDGGKEEEKEEVKYGSMRADKEESRTKMRARLGSRSQARRPRESRRDSSSESSAGSSRSQISAMRSSRADEEEAPRVSNVKSRLGGGGGRSGEVVDLREKLRRRKQQQQQRD